MTNNLKKAYTLNIYGINYTIECGNIQEQSDEVESKVQVSCQVSRAVMLTCQTPPSPDHTRVNVLVFLNTLKHFGKLILLTQMWPRL